MSEIENFKRLPSNVIPSHYLLRLEIDLLKCIFKGCVEIDIELVESLSEITLNCANLNISHISLIHYGNGTTFTPTYEISEVKETIKLIFNETLLSGSAILKITYDGELKDNLAGLYQSKYTVDGESRVSAVSQFENCDARRCFPCWDEPAIKATFDITLVVPKDRVALSNMEEVSRNSDPNDNSRDIVHFATSPIMSTYLVAVAVGEYEYVEKILDEGISIRVYAPPGRKEQGHFALDVAAKVVPYFTEYFGISYPLPKLDLIAIADLAAGAMENWGLITFREDQLLYDEANSSMQSKQSIAEVVGHEIAHQWFGNLVTMEWWTHLWLNEGYATFGQTLCIDHFFPDYDLWTQFVTSYVSNALILDGLENSHPIEVPVNSPDEISEVFDAISYDKGASIIRMMYHYVGGENFQMGMKLYLNRHKYKNATTDDLWQALEEASGKPLVAVMSRWCRDVGYPVISVSSKQDGGNRVLTLTQAKFLQSGKLQCSSTHQNWMIPITFSTSKDKNVNNYLLERKTDHLVIENLGENDWVNLNASSIGFYRVCYSSEMLNSLRGAILAKEMSPVDIVRIIQDSYALIKAGFSSSRDFFNLLSVFKDETNYHIWMAVDGCLLKLNKLMMYTSSFELFRKFGRDLLGNIWSKIGWIEKKNESHLERMLRSTILLRLGLFGDDDIYSEAYKRLQAHIKGEEILPVDLRRAVYCIVMKRADEKLYNQMIDYHNKTERQEEKFRIACSLGLTPNPELREKIYEFALSDSVRKCNSVFVFSSICSSREGQFDTWEFFKNNISMFHERFAGTSFLLNRLVEYACSGFVSEDMAEEIEEFFEENPIAIINKVVKQSIESIRINSTWLKRDSDIFVQFFNNLSD